MHGHASKPTPGALFALVATGVVIAALHAVWYAADARVPFMDQHRYYQVAEAAARCLDGTESPFGLVTLEGSHPPLYPILGGATMAVFGDGYETARMVNVALAPLLLLATWLLARRSLGAWGAWFAATLTGFAPLMFSFGHVFYIEALLVPLVVLTWWWVEHSNGLERPRSWSILGLLVGLGCLAKWTYPVFVGVPLAIAAVRSRRWRAFAGAAAVAAVMATPWYVTNLDEILAFFQRGVVAGEGHLSARTGLSGWLYYPKEIVLVGLGIPLSLAAAIGFLTVLRRDADDAVKLLVWAGVPVLVFSMVLTKKPRHVLPILPVLAIAATHAVLAVRGRRNAAIVGALLLAHVVTATVQASFRGPDPSSIVEVAGRRVPLLSEPSPIPGPPQRLQWPYEQTISALIAAGADEEDPALLLFNLTSFREDGFWYMRDRMGVKLGIGLIPFSWPEDHPAWERFPLVKVADDTPGLLDAGTIVVKTGRMWVRYGSRLPLHGYAAALSDDLLDGHPELARAFVEHARIDVDDGSVVVVFKRSDAPPAERKRAVARWGVAFDAAHPDAWKALGESVPPTQDDRIARMTTLGIEPIDGPPRAVDGDHAAWRLGPDPGRAALRLAEDAASEHRAHWLRRALRNDRTLAPDVRRAMQRMGIPPPQPLESLRDALRRATAGTRPPPRR